MPMWQRRDEATQVVPSKWCTNCGGLIGLAQESSVAQGVGGRERPAEDLPTEFDKSVL